MHSSLVVSRSNGQLSIALRLGTRMDLLHRFLTSFHDLAHDIDLSPAFVDKNICIYTILENKIDIIITFTLSLKGGKTELTSVQFFIFDSIATIKTRKSL